jgi:hypothetical protein
MPKIVCPRCGASARSLRDSQNRILIEFGDEFTLFCVEDKERHEAGEKNVPLGECKTFYKALAEADDNGVL